MAGATKSVFRELRRCAAWLAVGFVITVAVSWGLAAWMPKWGWHDDDNSDVKWAPSALRFDFDTHSAFGCKRQSWVTVRSSISQPRSALPWQFVPPARLPNQELSGRFADLGCYHATGWPQLGFFYEFDIDSNRGPLIALSGGIPLSDTPFAGSTFDISNVRALPYTPIWLGLAIDSVFWGAVAFGVVVGPSTVRASVRRRRGLCPACAYDLKGDIAAGCPECGWNRPSPEAQAMT